MSKHVKESDQEGEDGFDAEAVYSNQNDVCKIPSSVLFRRCLLALQNIDSPTRTAISRVANIIRVLSTHFVPLTDTLLLEAYEWSVEQEGDTKDLLQEDVGDALVATITARR